MSSDVLARQTERFTATGFDPNVAALLLAVAIPAAWWLARTARTRKRRLVAGLYPVPAAVAVVLTGSRGAIIAVAVAVLVTVSAGGGRRWTVALAAVLLAAVSIPLIARVAPERTVDRVTSVDETIEAGKANARLDIWRGGYRLYANAPLTGVGAGAFPTVSEPVFGKPRVVHNAYLSVLYELGLIGLAILCWIGALLVRQLRTVPLGPRSMVTALAAMWAGSALSLTMEPRKITFLIWGLANAAGALGIGTGPFSSKVSAERR